MSEIPQLQPQDPAEWSTTTHYATVENPHTLEESVIQVPENTSSVPIGELSDLTREGSLRPVRMPDTGGTLQLWLKEGVGTDANGEQRVALTSYDGENTKYATVPVEQYKKGVALRKQLGNTALGLPEPKQAAPAPVHEPYVPREIDKRMKRPIVVYGAQDPIKRKKH